MPDAELLAELNRIQETWTFADDADAIQAACHLAEHLLPRIIAQLERAARLELALDSCEMVMDTAAILGLPQTLPEIYRDSWARAQAGARAALTPGGAVVGVRTASESDHDRPPGSQRV